jgi:hypothetical protein
MGGFVTFVTFGVWGWLQIKAAWLLALGVFVTNVTNVTTIWRSGERIRRRGAKRERSQKKPWKMGKILGM